MLCVLLGNLLISKSDAGTYEMGATMQATDYCGYLLVRTYCCLLLVTMVTYWLSQLLHYRRNIPKIIQ